MIKPIIVLAMILLSIIAGWVAIAALDIPFGFLITISVLILYCVSLMSAMVIVLDEA